MSDRIFWAGLIVGWGGFWLWLLFAFSLGFLLWIIGVMMVLCVVVPGGIRLIIDTYRTWS